MPPVDPFCREVNQTPHVTSGDIKYFITGACIQRKTGFTIWDVWRLRDVGIIQHVAMREMYIALTVQYS